jgi:hypothetical protein
MVASGGLLVILGVLVVVAALAVWLVPGGREGEQTMGDSEDEIDRQMKETREQIDENLGVLEQRATSNAVRYGKIAAVVLGVAVVAGAGVLIYRRINRPTRTEQLRRMLIGALKDLPDALRDLPEDVVSKVKKPLPSIKIVVNAKEELGALERMVRRVAPALFGTASGAVIGRFTRPSDPEDAPSRSTDSAYD